MNFIGNLLVTDVDGGREAISIFDDQVDFSYHLDDVTCVDDKVTFRHAVTVFTKKATTMVRMALSGR